MADEQERAQLLPPAAPTGRAGTREGPIVVAIRCLTIVERADLLADALHTLAAALEPLYGAAGTHLADR